MPQKPWTISLTMRHMMNSFCNTGWDSKFWASLPVVKILTPRDDKLERCWWIATRRSISSSGEGGHSPELTLPGPFRPPAPTIGEGLALLLWGDSPTEEISEILASSVRKKQNRQSQSQSLSTAKTTFQTSGEFTGVPIGCCLQQRQIFKISSLHPGWYRGRVAFRTCPIQISAVFHALLTKAFHVCLSFSTQLMGQYFKIGHEWLLPNHYLVIVHHHHHHHHHPISFNII